MTWQAGSSEYKNWTHFWNGTSTRQQRHWRSPLKKQRGSPGWSAGKPESLARTEQSWLRLIQGNEVHSPDDDDGNLMDLLFPWINASISLAVLDGQPVLCIGGLPPCLPPPLKHGLSPIPLDEVVECHTPQVTTFNWASKDEGVSCSGISHNCFALTAPRANTPECLLSIEVVSTLYPIQFVRHFQKGWILNMNICSKIVSHKDCPNCY